MRVTSQQQACISGVLCVKLHLRSLFLKIYKYTVTEGQSKTHHGNDLGISDARVTKQKS